MSVPGESVAPPATGQATDSESSAAMAAKWRPLVAALLIVSLLLRVLAAILVERYVESANRSFLIEGDANGYWELGQKLAAGEDYVLHVPARHVLRVPGFPLLLAGCIKLFGDSVFAARMVLAVIGTACCGLTFLLGTRLHSRRVGFWAALFVSVHPLHVGNSVLILSESWFTFWMLLSLLSLVWLIDSDEETCDITAGHYRPCAWRLWLRSLLTGALTGITVLVRPGFLPWLGLSIATTLTFLHRRWWIRLLAVSGIMIGCYAILTPWALRNLSVTGHWVTTSLWSGPSLYDGLNPQADGSSNMEFFDVENVMKHQQMTEFQMNEHYKQRALQFAITNPGKAIHLAFKKALRFLSPWPNAMGGGNWATSIICVAFWALLFGAALVGLFSREWDLIGITVTLGPFLLFLLVHMVFVGSVRYRLPVESPVAVLAAIGWRRCLIYVQTSRNKSI